MPPSVPQLSSDQFAQTPCRGDLDLTITKSGVISGTLTSVAGAQQTGQVNAGDRVKLDASVTDPGFIGFVPAADDEAAIGCVKRTSKQAAFAAGDICEVAYFGGPVMYQVAGATVTPGATVEQADGFVQPLAANSPLGIALDYGVESGMIRVILMAPAAIQD